MELISSDLLCGRRITEIWVEEHIYEDEASILVLQLRLDSGDRWTARTSPSAEGLELATGQLRSIDMDQYGVIQARQLTGANDLGLGPSTIQAVWAVWGDGEEIGVRLRLASGEDTVVAGYGDEFWMQSPASLPFENLRYEPLCRRDQ